MVASSATPITKSTAAENTGRSTPRISNPTGSSMSRHIAQDAARPWRSPATQ